MKKNDISFVGQYIKDLSFENPMAPNFPPQNKNPKVNLDVNTTYLDLKNNNHEVNLRIKCTATVDSNTLFIIELQYAGLIKADLENDEDKKNLIISGSYFLFPFARSIITSITIDGGFKPFIMQPIKFENVFKK